MLLCSDGVLHSEHELIAWNAFCCDYVYVFVHCHQRSSYLFATYATLTHGNFLISRCTVVWGPRWYHLDFLIPKFPDFQVPDFQISRNLAWASLGGGIPKFEISRFPDFQISRFPDFQAPPAPLDELSDPNLIPLPTPPGTNTPQGAVI